MHSENKSRVSKDWPSKGRRALGSQATSLHFFHGSPPTNDWSAFINVVVDGEKKTNQSPT